jgi:hypothetical protein
MVTLSGRLLIDSALLCLAMSVIIFGSLRWNARLWLQDYPAEIKAKEPPLTKSEKFQRGIVAILFISALLGIPVLSTAQLRAANGGQLNFLSAYVNFWLLSNIANLFDALVIDWLILGKMKPAFVMLPSTKGLEHLFTDRKLHLNNFVKGVVICTVFSAPLALLAIL